MFRANNSNGGSSGGEASAASESAGCSSNSEEHGRTASSSSVTTTNAIGVPTSSKCPPQQLQAPPHDGLLVFTWGSGEDGQLGLGDRCDQDGPTYVDTLRGVAQVACGSGHTLALDTSGTVHSWGRGDDGRLGHGCSSWKYIPRTIYEFSQCHVTEVTCGSYHSAAVANGGLYTWGGGMFGKLGHGNETGCVTPKRVEGLSGVVVSNVACGSRHTCALTNQGCLYTWGDMENGVTGHRTTAGHQYTPRKVDTLAGKFVTQVSACGFHTACLVNESVSNSMTGDRMVEDDGPQRHAASINGMKTSVYTFGDGKFGRLGHNSEQNCSVPTMVESLRNKLPIQVSCGGFHLAIVCKDAIKTSLYTCGGGEHGQLGLRSTLNKLQPTLVESLESTGIVSVACGWSHTVALCRNGSRSCVYTWGNSDHGKLGHGPGGKITIPRVVEKLNGYNIVRVASYNEHTAALVEPLPPSPESTELANHHPVFVTPSYTSQLKQLVNDEEFADVTFLVENTPIYAHRAVLSQRCQHFATMFRSGMRESTERVIPTPNVSTTVFLLFLEYVYTDSVKVSASDAVELYALADLYQVERLRDMCCRVIRRCLCVSNAVQLLQDAANAHCELLIDLCMAYVVDNFDMVSKTDSIRSLSHDVLLEILDRR